MLPLAFKSIFYENPACDASIYMIDVPDDVFLAHQVEWCEDSDSGVFLPTANCGSLSHAVVWAKSLLLT